MASRYTLYTRPNTGGFVAEAAFELAGVPYDRVDIRKGVDDRPGTGYRKISPLGQVPALVLPDGTAITESVAISLLICDRYAPGVLAPLPDAPERGPFLRWLMFMSSAIYPAVLRHFYTDRYTADPASTGAVQAAALAEIDRDFVIVDNALDGSQWLAGQDFTIADVYLLMLAHWHPEGDRPREAWTNIVALCERLKQNPVIGRLNENHRLWG